jgi:uncharacterized membrane protein YphA (DoxX/SURF4 family)
MDFSRSQMNSLVVLRLLVGWHFLYEGVVKLFNPYWTAKTFLLTTEGALRPLFLWLAEEPMISVVNVANTALLLGVGAARCSCITWRIRHSTVWAAGRGRVISGSSILTQVFTTRPSQGTGKHSIAGRRRLGRNGCRQRVFQEAGCKA